jgi:5-methylcytosine-specific restriction endonuclease McrA
LKKSTKACSFYYNQDVSKKVKERDSRDGVYQCVYCRTTNKDYLTVAHVYIPAGKLGLAVEQNGVTLCKGVSNDCHTKFDSGIKRERFLIEEFVKEYMYDIYGNIDIDKLKYKKYKHYYLNKIR